MSDSRAVLRDGITVRIAPKGLPPVKVTKIIYRYITPAGEDKVGETVVLGEVTVDNFKIYLDDKLSMNVRPGQMWQVTPGSRVYLSEHGFHSYEVKPKNENDTPGILFEDIAASFLVPESVEDARKGVAYPDYLQAMPKVGQPILDISAASEIGCEVRAIRHHPLSEVITFETVCDREFVQRPIEIAPVRPMYTRVWPAAPAVNCFFCTSKEPHPNKTTQVQGL